jgi:glycolate oxidase
MMSENKKKKVIPHKLDPEVFEALKAVVGERWISQQRSVIETYSKFSIDGQSFLRKYAKDPHALPACIILPVTTEEVQAIVLICNHYKVPFLPFTNGQVFCSVTTPSPTLCIHMSRMNKVLTIDEDSMTATLQAYVDYSQLQAEAMKKGLWNGGAPLATSLCKLSSQFSFAGLWQTDLKYRQLNRNIVSVRMVLPDGDILDLGSRCLPDAGDFWDYGPGPDLLGMMRCGAGSNGIVTEITVKLHTWVGGKHLPEVPAGRPSLPDVHEPKYDSPPPPENHKLLWIEFPDMQSEINALHKISHSGVAIGLNATGVYSAYYCSQTQEMTDTRTEEGYFPPFNCYVIMAAITSPKQIAYEEKIVKKIAEETGGTILSENHKPHLLKTLAPWNLDWARHVSGFRMNRRMYASAWLPVGPFEMSLQHQQLWTDCLKTIGETHITDRGGSKDTPFIYAIDRGRFCFSETDNYPDPTDPDMIQKAGACGLYGMTRLLKEKVGNTLMAFATVEPLVSFYPEAGPNVQYFFRKIRRVFDPGSVCAPGRQVYTEEEMAALPEEVYSAVNSMRESLSMKPIKRPKKIE